MTSRPCQCITCKHMRPGMLCDAFPDGIPFEVLEGAVDHRTPIDGDNGVQWEPGTPDTQHPSRFGKFDARTGDWARGDAH